MKAVQYFDPAYLAKCREMKSEQVLRFLEDFRLLYGSTGAKSRLISVKMPEPLLNAFRAKCGLKGVRYQTQIKTLMRRWLEREEAE